MQSVKHLSTLNIHSFSTVKNATATECHTWVASITVLTFQLNGNPSLYSDGAENIQILMLTLQFHCQKFQLISLLVSIAMTNCLHWAQFFWGS